MATLAELAQAYLNQGLPSISGIFQPQAATPVTPVTPVEETPVISNTGITPQLLQPTGGGNDFNVYNPDPNTTRTSRNYVNPFPYDPMDDFGTPDYGYIDPPKEGLAGLFQKYVKNAPLTNILGSGIKAIGSMLPVNRRAILENELLGGGIMLDNIGRVVTDNYNTPEGIMAGYNANMLDPTAENNAFDKRQNIIANTLSEKYGVDISSLSDEEIENFDINNPAFNLVNRYGLIDQSKNLFKKRNDFADIVFQNELEKRRIKKEEKRQKDIQDAINKEKSKPGATTFNPNTTSGGRGNYRSDRDNSNDGGYGGSSKRSADNRSSDLGFSDIRLKENVELIGKSPSNINIYKFNYKDNPMTYQGAMAHEVPWASIKNSNGYMMVDYNQIDVDFKKYNA